MGLFFWSFAPGDCGPNRNLKSVGNEFQKKLRGDDSEVARYLDGLAPGSGGGVPEAPNNATINGRRGSGGGAWVPVVTLDTPQSIVAAKAFQVPSQSVEPVNAPDLATKNYVDSQRIPAGGTTAQVLAKRTSTDRDVVWASLPLAPIFHYFVRWGIGDNDPLNTAYPFIMPAANLPPIAIWYTVGGPGWGQFIVHNLGLGPITYEGSYAMEIEEPWGSGTFINAASFPSISYPGYLLVPNSAIRLPSAQTATHHVFQFNPATDGGIRFRARCSSITTPSRAATFNLGLEGQIVGVV